MTQALMRFEEFAADVVEREETPVAARPPRTAADRYSADRYSAADGSVSYLESYRSRRPAPMTADRDGEREIVSGSRVTTTIVIDETPLIRLIRTVIIALLVATACMLLVWIANLRATPMPEGPAPLPAAAVASVDPSAAVGG